MSEHAPAIVGIAALAIDFLRVPEATRADDIYDGGQWRVLRDPEGNGFCILLPLA